LEATKKDDVSEVFNEFTLGLLQLWQRAEKDSDLKEVFLTHLQEIASST